MKSLGTLFGYELKKIWGHPLLWVALLLAMVVSSASTLPSDLWSDSGGNLYVTYKDGRKVGGYITQKEKLHIELEWAPKLNGQVLDEAFFRGMRNSLRELELGESNAAFRSDLEAYFLMVDPTYYGYYRYANLDGDFQHITEKRYYARARTMRLTELSTSWYGELTEEEIDYWTQLGDQVQTPYEYSYYRGWSSIGQTLSLTISWLLPLLVGICLCSVFSRERHDRTEALILSSQWGRLPVYLAKGLAGTASALLVVLSVIAAAAATAFLVYGGGWYDTPIQVALPTCWPITMGQGLLIRLGLYLSYALLCSGMVMLVSLLTGSGVAGLTASVFMMVLQNFLPRYMVEASWLPGNILSSSVFQRYQLVNLLGMRFNWVELDLFMYAAVGMALLALCWLGWRRRALGRA